DVIEIDADNAFEDEVVEDVVHHGLKGGRAIKHHRWLKHPPVCLESCFPLIAVFYPDIVIPPSDVQFREPFCPSQFVQQVPYQRQWVGVLDCAIVQIPVVLTWSQGI
ncbi:hypothetical protein L208DRAFT_1272838, partial [Tricholoma matsutake]